MRLVKSIPGPGPRPDPVLALSLWQPSVVSFLSTVHGIRTHVHNVSGTLDPTWSSVFSRKASGKDSELKANMVPFFQFKEINSREILSSYPRRPVLRVGYVLKLCPREFSYVLGLTMCVVCVHIWRCVVCMIRQKWKVDYKEERKVEKNMPGDLPRPFCS